MSVFDSLAGVGIFLTQTKIIIINILFNFIKQWMERCADEVHTENLFPKIDLKCRDNLLQIKKK